MRSAAIPPALLFALQAPLALQAQNARMIDDYLQQMHYDPRKILAIQEPGSVESVPARTINGTNVVVCASKVVDLNKDLSEVVIFSPSTSAIFPGALVRANRNLAEGKPDLVTLVRGPLHLSVDLPGLAENGEATVQKPTKATVQTALHKMETAWFDKGQSQAARETFEVKKAYSSTQLALDLGVSAKWATGPSLKVESSASHTANHSTCVALFKQVYYTASVDPPGDPSEVFDPSVTLDQVKRTIDSSNPLAYVKSVDYGRIILVRMETSSTEDEASLAAAMEAVKGGPATVNGKTDLNVQRIIDQSSFSVVALGGNADDASRLMDMGKGKQAESRISQVIKASAVFSAKNPGFPIAYTVDFLKDNSLATFNFTTKYTQTECREYPSGFVKVRTTGGYVARFKVSWDEPDASGKGQTRKEWSSGNVSSGYEHTVDLPGDARNVKLLAEENTGFSWREALSRTEPGPTNKTYTISGTTLNPRSSISN